MRRIAPVSRLLEARGLFRELGQRARRVRVRCALLVEHVRRSCEGLVVRVLGDVAMREALQPWRLKLPPRWGAHRRDRSEEECAVGATLRPSSATCSKVSPRLRSALVYAPPRRRVRSTVQRASRSGALHYGATAKMPQRSVRNALVRN